jgi:glycine/D-amino acid oxidase-like deaminating enzyme
VPLEDAPRGSDILVVGAGVLGAWTAYWAKRNIVNGAIQNRRVTLLDAWGTGNPRATSGDETRLLFSSHAADELYRDWSRRSRELWLQSQEEWGFELFEQSGVLFFAHRGDVWERASVTALNDAKIPCEVLSPDDLRERWPQMRSDDLSFAVFEPEGGILFARRCCQAVVEAFQKSGGTYSLGAVSVGRAEGSRLLSVVDTEGQEWTSDNFVFACGPWLPRLFPDILGSFIRITKQDVIYFGPPEGDSRFDARSLPGWVDQDGYHYGVPAVDGRGFKIGSNRLGPVFDPSNGERMVDPDSVRLVRRYLAQRFPDLSERPVVDTHVCQYETTSDEAFLIDRHPAYSNVWLVGGGSGRGFKQGPRVGEYVVSMIEGGESGPQTGKVHDRFGLRPRGPRLDLDTGIGDGVVKTWPVF